MVWDRVIKEDGTLVDGANSYINEADFEDYLVKVGMNSLESESGYDADAQTAVIMAAQYINSLAYIGCNAKGAVMRWPRSGAGVDDDVVPAVVLEAQSWLALKLMTNPSTALWTDTTDGELRSKQIEGLRKEWFAPSERSKSGIRFDYIDNILIDFLDDANAGIFVGGMF